MGIQIINGIKNIAEKIESIQVRQFLGRNIVHLKKSTMVVGLVTVVAVFIFFAYRYLNPSKKPWEKLKSTFDKANNTEKMMNLLQQFLVAPEKFSETRPDRNGEIFLNGFSFSECNCRNFSRSSSDIRKNAELTIVDFFVNHYPDKEKQLHIASFGSGGMLQDVVIIGKLVVAGFKNIKLCCLDSVTPESKCNELEVMMNKLPGVSIEVYKPSDVVFLHRNEELFDGIYAIDFDDLNTSNGSGWRTIINGQNSLKPNGKMFLYADTKATLQRNGHIESLNKNSSIVEQLTQNNNLALIQQAEEVFISMTKETSEKNFEIPTIVSFLQLVSQGKEKKINLQLFGNEPKGIFSDYKLDGHHYGTIITDCSKLSNLTVSYSSDKLPEKDNSIFINEKTVIQL